MTSSEHGLRRDLGVRGAVAIGLGAMVGAGVFVVYAPAARAAGTGLLVALAVAAVVAACNATSSARLAALYPASGGTYVYGRERLGPLWGYLAGWSFVVGKTASCAAMALTVGAYAWPAHAHLVAVAAVVVVTGVGCAGVQRSATVAAWAVALVLAVLAVVVVVSLTSDASDVARVVPGADVRPAGVLQAAGLLFFAFAGYARVATLGEEVRDPARTIPRAILVALGITFVVYAAVAVAVLAVLGAPGLARSGAPLADAVRGAGSPGLLPVVRAAAVLAAGGALLALMLGVSRTTLAMARDRHLPSGLTAVSRGVPYRAELAVGAVVAVLAAATDVRAVLGFSSFGVLVYYAVANASALTMTPDEGRAPRVVPVVGLAGCVVLAATLPWSAVVPGVVVVALGALAYALRSRHAPPAPTERPGGRRLP